jgi:hypothetical protein
MAASLVGAGQFKLTLLPPTRASNSVTALYSGLLSYRHWATWPLRSHGQPGASPVSADFHAANRSLVRVSSGGSWRPIRRGRVWGCRRGGALAGGPLVQARDEGRTEHCANHGLFPAKPLVIL